MTEHRAGRIILHADLDAFFASVEEREDPSLKGRPVVIGSDPKGGHGRGIVATCSYAARRFGIRSAMPISQAWRRCPSAVFLRPRFSLYSEASRAVMSILREGADSFEQVSIDEAYLDASTLGTFEAARDLARGLQRAVHERERLSISVGAGPNKLVAKLASDHRKPGGVTVVIPSRVQEFLDPKPVRALRGVGPVTEAHLHGLGFETVAQLRTASEEKLRRELGSFGRFLWEEARGIDSRPVDPVWEAKSVGRERTFDEDTADEPAVLKVLLSCVERVCRDLRQDNLWAHTFTVKVRYSGYETHSRQTTLRQPTGALKDLEKTAAALLGPFLGQGRAFRLVGFTAGRLVPPEELLPFG